VSAPKGSSQFNNRDRDSLDEFLIRAVRQRPHLARLSPETQARLDAWRARKTGTVHAQESPGLQDGIPFVTSNANT
jgi:hypothetical protein